MAKFEACLRCDMTEDEIPSCAKEADVEVVKPAPTNAPWIVLAHGRTHLNVCGNGGKLTSIQTTWVSKPMATSETPRRNLCTWESVIAVEVVTTQDWMNAQVRLDGVDLGTVDERRHMESGPGEHLLEITGTDGRRFQRKLVLKSDGPGTVEVDVR